MMWEDIPIDDEWLDRRIASQELPGLRRGDQIVVCRGDAEACRLRADWFARDEAYRLRPAHVRSVERSVTGAVMVDTSRASWPIQRGWIVFVKRGDS